MPSIPLLIDGKEASFTLTIYPFDEDSTLLTRAAVRLGRLPETVRLDSTPGRRTPVKSKGTFAIRTIESELESLPLTGTKPLSLTDLSYFRAAYPSVSKGQLGILLMKVNGGVPVPGSPLFGLLRELSRTLFPSSPQMGMALSDYDRNLPRRLSIFVEETTVRERTLNDLFLETRGGLATISEFVLEETNREYLLKLTRTIEEVFDRMTVSYEIPFAILRTPERTFLKVHADYLPSEERLAEIEEYLPGVYFDFRLAGTKYFSGRLNADGELVILFPKEVSRSTEEIFRKWLTSIDLPLEVLGERDQGVKGYFTVNSPFSRVTYAHLISLDPIISSFLTLEEREKTALEKNRFYTIYLNGVSRLTLLFLPDLPTSTAHTPLPSVTARSAHGSPRSPIGQPRYNLRVLNAKSLEEINRFAAIFSRMVQRIEGQAGEVAALYGPLLDGVRERKASVSSAKGSRERSKALRGARPDLFITDYPTVCQKTKQPYLVVGSEAAEKLRQHFIETSTDETIDAANKIIEYPTGSGDYYACEPRDETDTSKGEIWPGLQVNKKLPNRDTHPFLPCCFTVDQVRKAGSTYNKYLNARGAPVIGKEESSSYVLSSNKMPPVGRMASLPFLLGKLATASGFPSMVRFGAAYRRDSLIFCLEVARDIAFSARDERSVESGIAAAKARYREKLPEHYLACLTEFSGMSLQDASDELMEGFLDPRKWFTFFERVLGYPIFVFQVTTTIPEGAMARPFFTERFLPAPIPEAERSVGLVMVETKDPANPWQTEILCPVQGRFFMTGKLHKMAQAFRRRAFISSSVQPPDSLFDGVEAVVPDRSGAVRVLLFKTGVLVVPPIRNVRALPVGEVGEKIIRASALRTFLTTHRLKIQTLDMPDGENLKGLGALTPQGVEVYLPLVPIPLEDSGLTPGEMALPPYARDDPLRVEDFSALSALRHSEKEARIFLAYAKLLASLRGALPTKEDFAVEEGFTVPIEELDNRLSVDAPMFRKRGPNALLRVPSQEVAERLIASVKVALLNDHDGIMAYSSHASIPGTYLRVSDFRVHPSETILSGSSPSLREALRSRR